MTVDHHPILTTAGSLISQQCSPALYNWSGISRFLLKYIEELRWWVAVVWSGIGGNGYPNFANVAPSLVVATCNIVQPLVFKCPGSLLGVHGRELIYLWSSHPPKCSNVIGVNRNKISRFSDGLETMLMEFFSQQGPFQKITFQSEVSISSFFFCKNIFFKSLLNLIFTCCNNCN